MCLFEYSTEEVMGKILVEEFITNKFKTITVQAVLDQAFHSEKTSNFQLLLMTKRGRQLDVLLNTRTQRNEQGYIIGVVDIGQDITGCLAQEC
jgi:PAS domain S-box-containing protein